MIDPPFPLFPLLADDDVGPWRECVVVASIPEFDQFLVRAIDSGDQFAVVKGFTDPEVYNKLCTGTRVRLRATKKLPRVVSVEIIQ